MSNDEPEIRSDLWSEWILSRRHAEDDAYNRTVRAAIESYADRVIDGAQLVAGMTLADIGSGDGLVAFRAIDRIGPSLGVILTDISAPLLRHARTLAAQRNVLDQCVFLECAAGQLGNIADASVDAVTTRAVLAYVADKCAALREFHRILKPGGRLSIAEPLFRDEAIAACALKKVVDARTPQSQDRFMPLLYRWKAAQYPDTEQKIAQSPSANYSERDLLNLVSAAGYVDIHMEFHVDVLPAASLSWEAFIGSSPHPLAPSLKVILAEQFLPEEQQLFEQVMRPTVESGRFVTTDRIVYINARKAQAANSKQSGH